MSTIFAEPRLNAGPPKAIDGREDTFETSSVLTFNIDTDLTGVGAARPFTHIHWVGEGVTGYSIAASGGNVIGVSPVWSTTDTDSSGETVSKIINGRHYETFHWENSNIKATARYLTITFTGSNIKIYKVLVLNSIVELVDGAFSSVEWDKELPGFIQTSARGRRSVAPGIAGMGSKHNISLVTQPKQFNRTDEVARALDAFFDKYQEFGYMQEYTRFPDQVIEACVADRRVQSQYKTGWKAIGRTVQYTISEL